MIDRRADPNKEAGDEDASLAHCHRRRAHPREHLGFLISGGDGGGAPSTEWIGRDGHGSLL